jgi:hypothetical protein
MDSRKLAALAVILDLLTGCATIRVKPEAEQVRITFDVEEVRHCTRLGEVVGSEGSWYDAWLISNEVLIMAAVNDVRNKAHARGADTVLVPGNTFLFATSVTILGQAYQCQDGHSRAWQSTTPAQR